MLCGLWKIFPHNNVSNYCSNCGAPLNYEERKKDYIKQVKERRQKINEIHIMFKNDVFEYFDVVDNPKAELCFDIAWSEGHSNGLENVVDWFDELVELIK